MQGLRSVVDIMFFKRKPFFSSLTSAEGFFFNFSFCHHMLLVFSWVPWNLDVNTATLETKGKTYIISKNSGNE